MASGIGGLITPVDINSRKKLNMKAGDTVKVWQRIQEKDKTRLQAFEGLVLGRKHGTEPGATFTIRRNTGGYGVEKIFPLYSPMIDKIEVLKRSKVRRSKLYYIREKALKEVSKRFKMTFVDHSTEDNKTPEPAEEKQEESEVVKEEIPIEEPKESFDSAPLHEGRGSREQDEAKASEEK
jgi:large subunit ribosomal protein L19